MKKIGLYALVVLGTILGMAGCGDGIKEPALQGRSGSIVGGEVFEGFPAVGTFVYDGYQHCTGTLISSKKILTAAHCLAGVQASRMYFFIGPNAYEPENVLQVESVAVHPDYDSYNIRNDIGLAILAEEAPVEPMEVVRQMDETWVGEELFFVGYGVESAYSGSGSGIKRAVWIAVNEVYSTAFLYVHSSKNTCAGDSGGPAFVRDPQGNYKVAGVTSYGDYACASYGVDTRVDAYLDFLGLDGSSSPSAGCQGETFKGRCHGDTVVWCEEDRVLRQDCSASDRSCVFDEEQEYYACRQLEDPCQGETWVGRCEVDTVIWCEDDQVKVADCTETDRRCTWNDESSYYDCM